MIREGDIEAALRTKQLLGHPEGRKATRNRPFKMVRTKDGGVIHYKKDEKGRIRITEQD